MNFLITPARLKSFSSVESSDTEITEDLFLVFFDKILILKNNIPIEIKTKINFLISVFLDIGFLSFSRTAGNSDTNAHPKRMNLHKMSRLL